MSKKDIADLAFKILAIYIMISGLGSWGFMFATSFSWFSIIPSALYFLFGMMLWLTSGSIAKKNWICRAK